MIRGMLPCFREIEYRRCCQPRCLGRKLDLQFRQVVTWLSKSREGRPVKRLQSGCDQLDSVSREIRLVTPTAVTPSLVDLERSGSLEKSIRVVAIVLRFVQRRRRQAQSSDTALRIRES